MLKLHQLNYYTNYKHLSRKDAQQLLGRAEQIIMKHGGKLHPAYFFVLVERSLFHRWSGEHEQSIVLAENHLDLFKEKWGTRDPWRLKVALELSGSSLLSAGINEKARAFYDDFWELLHDFYRKDAPGQSGSARLMMLKDFNYSLEKVLSVARVEHDLVSAYNQVLVVKGSASSFQIADQLAHDHPELTSQREKVRVARQTLKHAAFTGNSNSNVWIERLVKASNNKEIADSRLAFETRSIVSTNRQTVETEVTWQEMQSKLPTRTAFIDFVQYTYYHPQPGNRGTLLREPEMLAFIVRRDAPPVCVELGYSQLIHAGVEAWRKSIDKLTIGKLDNIEGPTHELAKLIWNPLQNYLEGVDSLVIAPDGPLCFVSFAALPGRARGSYALEDYAIHYANSGRWLYQQLTRPKETQVLRGSTDPAHALRGSPDPAVGTDRRSLTRGGLLVVGDIQYHATNNVSKQKSREILPDCESIQNLIATQLEIDEVNELFSKNVGVNQETRTLTQRHATAEEFATALERNWQCVHFAGHGLFIPPSQAAVLTGQIQDVTVQGDRGAAGHANLGRSDIFVRRNQLLLSGLVLAPSSASDSKPGFLTAEEIGSLDLRRTDLVVLSACETGIGCTAGGDGVLGLTRAFLTAGARSVVSSLWKVDDAATSLLMREFYSNLWERGMTKSESLRQAQLTVLRDARLIKNQRDNLVTQLHQSLPDLSKDELREELARSRRGLVPREEDDIDGGATNKEPVEPDYIGSNSTRTHPALWAAFILNGDAR